MIFTFWLEGFLFFIFLFDIPLGDSIFFQQFHNFIEPAFWLLFFVEIPSMIEFFVHLLELNRIMQIEKKLNVMHFRFNDRDLFMSQTFFFPSQNVSCNSISHKRLHKRFNKRQFLTSEHSLINSPFVYVRLIDWRITRKLTETLWSTATNAKSKVEYFTFTNISRIVTGTNRWCFEHKRTLSVSHCVAILAVKKKIFLNESCTLFKFIHFSVAWRILKRIFFLISSQERVQIFSCYTFD